MTPSVANQGTPGHTKVVGVTAAPVTQQGCALLTGLGAMTRNIYACIVFCATTQTPASNNNIRGSNTLDVQVHHTEVAASVAASCGPAPCASCVSWVRLFWLPAMTHFEFLRHDSAVNMLDTVMQKGSQGIIGASCTEACGTVCCSMVCVLWDRTCDRSSQQPLSTPTHCCTGPAGSMGEEHKHWTCRGFVRCRAGLNASRQPDKRTQWMF
jgi:hypothetical protein